MPSTRASRATLLLLPLLASLLLLSAAMVAGARRPEQQVGTVGNSVSAPLSGRNLLATETPPCLFDFDHSIWFGACTVNPDWLAQRRVFSPLAKLDRESARVSGLCAKHDVSSGSADDFAKCDADNKNWCYVSAGAVPGSSWQCMSNSNGVFAKASLLCPGAIFTQAIQCSTRKATECDKPDGLCKFFHTYPSDVAYQTMQASSYGFANKYSCVPSVAPTSSVLEYSAWARRINAGTSEPEVLAYRGNCSYAVSAAKRIAIYGRCTAMNSGPPNNPRALGLGGDGTVAPFFDQTGNFVAYIVTNQTTLNATLVSRCLNTLGCHVANNPGYEAAPELLLPGEAPGAYCEPDYAIYNGLKYSDRREKPITDAYRLCSSPALQWNRALCGAAAL